MDTKDPVGPTPGPWKFKRRVHEGKLIALILETEHRPISANDPAIFALRQDWMGTLCPQREADKRWIERVPTMYAALKDITEVLGKHPESTIGNKVVHYALHKARNAIAPNSVQGGAESNDCIANDPSLDTVAASDPVTTLRSALKECLGFVEAWQSHLNDGGHTVAASTVGQTLESAREAYQLTANAMRNEHREIGA